MSTNELQLDRYVAELGGMFSGLVSLQPPFSSQLRQVEIRLRYRTEGRGDTDKAEVAKAVLPVAGAKGQFEPIQSRFEVKVPTDAPISYDGDIIRVIWEIELRRDIRLNVDKRSHHTVLVVPIGGMGIYQGPHPLPARGSSLEPPFIR